MYFLLRIFFIGCYPHQPELLTLLSVGTTDADSSGRTNQSAYMFFGHWVWHADCKSADMASTLKMLKSGGKLIG
jgi:hypothetical protein